MNERPGKTKIAAGLECGMLWTVYKGINQGDIDLNDYGFEISKRNIKHDIEAVRNDFGSI